MKADERHGTRRADMKANDKLDEMQERIAAHYRHAVEKHPRFVDKLFIIEGKKSFLEDAESQLDAWRMLSTLGEIDAESIFTCEFAEARRAYAQGYKEVAISELYDTVAVLLRMVDVLEGRQALGDPAREADIELRARTAR